MTSSRQTSGRAAGGRGRYRRIRISGPGGKDSLPTPADSIPASLRGAVETGIVPGAVLLAWRGTRTMVECAGWAQIAPRREQVSTETIFDLSSLTKPVATTTAVMCLVRDGLLHLDDPLARFFRPSERLRAIAVRHLLAHTSGLPAWRPYFRRYRGDQVVDRILRETPLFRAGTRALYSDLGFILLGKIVERASGGSLDRFCDEAVFRPLGMRETTFHPPPERCAATEVCPWRKRLLRGEVHDENAWAMGGVAGHAGLFSTAADPRRFSAEIVRCWSGQGGLIPRRIARGFLTPADRVPRSTWTFGWDTPTPGGSASGRYFSRRTVGHLGFTGTSLWIDLARGIAVVLLTNRVHPTRRNDRIRRYRPIIHDLVMREWALR